MQKATKEELLFGVFLPPVIGKILSISTITGFEDWAHQTFSNITIYKLIGLSANMLIAWILAYLINFKYKQTMNLHKGNVAIMFILAMSVIFSFGAVVKFAKSIPEGVLSPVAVPAPVNAKNVSFTPINANIFSKPYCGAKIISFNEFAKETPINQFVNAFTDDVNTTLYKWVVFSTCYTSISEAEVDYCKIKNKVGAIGTILSDATSIRIVYAANTKENAQATCNVLLGHGFCFAVGQIKDLR